MQRQYTGTLGKIGNRQIGVSLTVATKHEHVPIDFALYMPKSWTDDALRREKARVPDELVFKTKPELALDLITRAVDFSWEEPARQYEAGYEDAIVARTLGCWRKASPVRSSVADEDES